jgi:phage FluMu gp28-like protein
MKYTAELVQKDWTIMTYLWYKELRKEKQFKTGIISSKGTDANCENNFYCIPKFLF